LRDLVVARSGLLRAFTCMNHVSKNAVVEAKLQVHKSTHACFLRVGQSRAYMMTVFWQRHSQTVRSLVHA
jgi:hypothetical protein